MFLAASKMRYFILVTLLSYTTLHGAVEVIELDYLDAQEAIELLKPMMGKGESVSGSNGRLVLNTGLAMEKKVRKVLRTFDAAPVNLQISIRHVGSKVEVVESGHLVVRQSNLSGGAHSSRITTDSRGTFSTRVLNGGAAYLETGKSVVSMKGKQVSARYGFGRATASASSAELGSRGVWVSPKVKGDRVTVKMSLENIQKLPQGLEREQRFSFVVKGKLGEWLSLRKSGFRQSTEDRKVLSTHSRKLTENEVYEVKVVRLGH